MVHSAWPSNPANMLPITKVALLNIRSLTQKSFLINDLITNCNLDLMVPTETWLNDHWLSLNQPLRTVKVAATSPP